MSKFSLSLGNFLYRRCFPLYNIIYRFFKLRQDKREISIMQAHIKPGDTVLDVGANIGFYTAILSRLVGNEGKIFAFEPDRTNFKHLTANCGNLKNTTLLERALSSETGALKIYKSSLLNVDHRTYPVDEYESIEEIQCVSADDFFTDGQHVDFIKIDIQGYEVSAFKGMGRILRESPDLKILSEFWPYGLKKAGETPMSLLSIFWDAGLSVYFVAPNGFELMTPENLYLYNNEGFSAYMNIFVTRNNLSNG